MTGAAIFAAAYPWINWAWVFNIKDAAIVPEAGTAMICLVACFLVNLPLGVVTQTQNGYQEGFANSLWAGVGSVLSLAAVVVACYLRAGLPWLVLTMAGVPPVCMLANGVVLFWVRKPWLRPAWSRVRGKAARYVMQTGLLFFVLQLAGVVAYQTDNMVLAQMMGLDTVTVYAVPTRLFAVVPLILGFALMPLWPAYGEALVRGDVKWIRTTLRRSLAAGLLITVPAAVVLTTFGVPIIHVWTRRGNLTPPVELMVGLGIWTVMGAFNWAFAMLLNGLHVIGFQAIWAVVMAVANLGLSILFTHYIGVSGVLYGTIVSQLVFMLVPSAIYVRKRMAQMSPEPVLTNGPGGAVFGVEQDR